MTDGDMMAPVKWTEVAKNDFKAIYGSDVELSVTKTDTDNSGFGKWSWRISAINPRSGKKLSSIDDDYGYERTASRAKERAERQIRWFKLFMDEELGKRRGR